MSRNYSNAIQMPINQEPKLTDNEEIVKSKEMPPSVGQIQDRPGWTKSSVVEKDKADRHPGTPLIQA